MVGALVYQKEIRQTICRTTRRTIAEQPAKQPAKQIESETIISHSNTSYVYNTPLLVERVGKSKFKLEFQWKHNNEKWSYTLEKKSKANLPTAKKDGSRPIRQPPTDSGNTWLYSENGYYTYWDIEKGKWYNKYLGYAGTFGRSESERIELFRTEFFNFLKIKL